MTGMMGMILSRSDWVFIHLPNSLQHCNMAMLDITKSLQNKHGENDNRLIYNNDCQKSDYSKTELKLHEGSTI